jgi:small subunit ribosomal protein S8e
MSIARDSRHKRRATGGRMPVHKKKRQYEHGRPMTMTKLGAKRVRPLRCRGGNYKHKALRLDNGNYSWGSESVTRKTRIIDVVYNATNNELVRTKTLVKNAIVQVDATPFRQWYLQHYGVELGKKKAKEEAAAAT